MGEIFDFSNRLQLFQMKSKTVKQNYDFLISYHNKTPTAAFAESYKLYSSIFPEIDKSDVPRKLAGLLNPINQKKN